MKCKRFFEILSVFLVYEMMLVSEEVVDDFEEWLSKRYPRESLSSLVFLSDEDNPYELWPYLKRYTKEMIWPEVIQLIREDGWESFMDHSANHLFESIIEENWPIGHCFPFSGYLRRTMREKLVPKLMRVFRKGLSDTVSVPVNVGMTIFLYIAAIYHQYADACTKLTDILVTAKGVKLN